MLTAGVLLAWLCWAAPGDWVLGADKVILAPTVGLEQLHELLRRGGFGPGVYNPEDHSQISQALKRLQQARGLPVTGKLDYATWQALRGSGAAGELSSRGAQPDASRPKWPSGLVAGLQGWLRDLGYKGVKPTGRLDKGTLAALERFRKREKIPPGKGLDAAVFFAVVQKNCPQGCKFTVSLMAPGANPEAVGGEGYFQAKVNSPYPRAAFLKILAMALTRQGYTAKPSGRLDPGLQSALLRFQAASRLKATGRPDGPTVAALFNLACVEGCSFEVNLGQKAGPSGDGPPGRAAVSVIKKVDPAVLKLRRLVKVGEAVLAVENLNCSQHSGHWVLYFSGQVTAVGPDGIKVRIAKRYGYRYRAKAQGINTKDWWCIPARRHCYSQVKFKAWGGKIRLGEIVRFPVAKVFNEDIGVINAMMIYLAGQCKK